MMDKKLFACPCCGYYTLQEKPPGTYEICDICYWEDDPIQFEDPFLDEGANEVSLMEAQLNFIDFGASDEICIDAVRKPTEQDKKDPNFKLIEWNMD